jgi:hypothetical protein
MAMQEKPTLTIVAGREGPTEGPYPNAARIADVKAKMSAAPQKAKASRALQAQDSEARARHQCGAGGGL